MKDLSTLQPKRILVCQQRQLGDALLATPVFGLLKQRTDYRRMLRLRDEISQDWWQFVRWDARRKCVTAQPYWSWRSRMDRKYHLNLKHHGKRRTRPAA